MRILQHIADIAVQPQLGAFPVVPAVDEDGTLCWLKKAAGQVDQGGFSRTGFADNSDRGAGGDLQIEVLQNVFVPVRIAECHISEFDITADRLPIFGFPHKIVPVLLYHVGGILNNGYLFQKAADTFDVGLGGDNVRQNTGNLLDGLKNAHRVGSESRQSSNFHQSLHR